MAEDLKTARLVQDSLFPQKSFYKNGRIRLYGMHRTSTKCGGDWWFYFQRGNDLYLIMADAAAHGIPAALITSATRSAFSLLKEEDRSLKNIAAAWDKAIAECSNGRITMTALIFRANVELGECRFINAGHENPIIARKARDGFKASPILGEMNYAIGERKDIWLEDSLQLQPNDRLILYTDGFFKVRSPKGETVSDRRFLKLIEKTLTPNQAPDIFAEKIVSHFHDLGAGAPLHDDLTFMVLDFT